MSTVNNMASGGTLIQRFRVPIGFLFGFLMMALSNPSLLTIVIGGVPAVFGLFIRAWASGHIQKNKVLTISGPYAFTRNPLYLGNFLLGLGFAIASGVWWIAVIFVVLFLGIYLRVMNVESQELTGIFGEEYGKYAKDVSLFIPWFGRQKYSGKGNFDFNLYMRHREYEALLGGLFAWSVLALKAWYFGTL